MPSCYKLLKQLSNLFSSITVKNNSRSAHKSILKLLINNNFSVISEYSCSYFRNNCLVNGRIDIRARKYGYKIGIEIDSKKPHIKSICKLRSNSSFDLTIILLRHNSPKLTPVKGIDLILPLSLSN